MIQYTKVDACRCCGSGQLEPVLNLGRQPLANDYVKQPIAQPTYPLELFVCRQCYHNQLSIAVDPNQMFKEYLYVSGTSRTLRDHFSEFAKDTLSHLEPGKKRVLDIACNDGTLLTKYRDLGCSVHGVDPAANLVKLVRDQGIAVVEGYWPDASKDIVGRFDIVTACNVLAHVAEPARFLSAMLSALSPDGVAVVEFPYAREMVLRNEWDTIYHEHLSYFLVAPFLKLAERVGAVVTYVKTTPIHGGSIRFGLRRMGGSHCAEANSLAMTEQVAGLHDLETYIKFAKQVSKTCRELVEGVGAKLDAGYQVVGYGASAKGNTLLNHCPLALTYIVDDNPLKHGHFTPGRHLPIRPVSVLSGERQDLAIVMLAWNFADEIKANVRRLRPGREDLALCHVPNFSVTPI